MELTRPQQAILAIGGLFAALILFSFMLTQPGISNWLVIALCGGIGYGIGFLFSPEGKFTRRLIAAGALAVLMMVALSRYPWFSYPATITASLIAFAGGLIYWAKRVAGRFFERPTTFGSAEWATHDYLKENDLFGDDGIALGRVSDGEQVSPLRYNGDRHLLTVAPTRSGKGTTAIIPNLLTYPGSALVIDPKGENAMITADARRARNQTVHIVDPWGIVKDAKAARFNPLDWLAPGDVDMTENAMLLADALVVPSDHDRFWSEEAKALLQGLILYVATDEREAGTRHLGRVRDLLLLDGEDMPLLFQRMTESPHHIVASTGARCLQKEEKLLANVVASAQAETHFLDSARIRESLSSSDFAFEDLKKRRMTVYLVLPTDRLNAFGRWLRLLIQQAITVNARDIARKPLHSVLFILDEMPALGRLSMIEQAFGLMAGYGMQLWGIVQDISQLKRIYGDGWETFVGNAGVLQYFGSRDRSSAEYFSALCGMTTVWSLSSAIGRSFGGGSSSSSSTDTTAAAQRNLAYPDELMRLPRAKQLLFIEDHRPIRAEKRRWFDDEKLSALGRNLRKGGQ